MKISLGSLTLPILAAAGLACATTQATKDFNKALGRGINMGNMLEGPTEGAWAPMLTANDMALVAGKGFQSVRVPIRWDGEGAGRARDFDRVLREAPYTVDDRFFARIDSVVSWARQNKLLLVINDHHNDSLLQDYERNVPRFLAIWEQIAERYKNLPDDSVAFEIMNEPHEQVTSDRWNWLADTALKIIRKTNPARPVVIGTADWGGIGSMRALEVPDDSNLILTIHDYSPFNFTHQGASFQDPPIPVGTKWGGYWDLRQSIEDVQRIAEFAKEKDLPVWIGEFGALPYADTASRLAWAASKTRLYEQAGFSWAWWEFRSTFGVYYAGTKTWNTKLLDALFSSDTSIIQLGAPPQGDAELAFNGEFALGDTGWSLNLPKGKATFSVDSGSGLVVVDSATPGTSWGVQLIQAPIRLKKGYSYVLMFSARADQEISIDASVGMNQDPWANYGSANGLKIGLEPRSFFTSAQVPEDDTTARICFNVGNTNGRVRIDSVRLFEYAPDPVSVDPAKRSAVGFRQIGASLRRTGPAMPASRHLLDVRGARVASLDWTRQGDTWVADLSQAPRNRLLFLDREASRVFLR